MINFGMKHFAERLTENCEGSRGQAPGRMPVVFLE